MGAVRNHTHPDIETAAAATVHTGRTFTPLANRDPSYEIYRMSYDALHEIHQRLAALHP